MNIAYFFQMYYTLRCTALLDFGRHRLSSFLDCAFI